MTDNYIYDFGILMFGGYDSVLISNITFTNTDWHDLNTKIGQICFSKYPTTYVSIINCTFQNMSMKYNSIVAFDQSIDELLFEGNVLQHLTAFSDSNLLDLQNIKSISLKRNHFLNLTYEKDGQPSNLLNIRKETLTQLRIEELLYENSELNFLKFHGLNPINSSFSKVEMDGIKVRNIVFERQSQLFTTSSFFSEMEIEMTLANSKFSKISFLKFGKFF